MLIAPGAARYDLFRDPGDYPHRVDARPTAEARPPPPPLNAGPVEPLFLHPPSWRGQYVRVPTETRSPAITVGKMVTGVRNAIHDDFVPWLASKPSGSDTAGFVEMLKAMHRTIGSGSRDERYAGWMAGLAAENGNSLPGHMMVDGKRPGYRYSASVGPSTAELRGKDFAHLPEGESVIHVEGLSEGATGKNTKSTRPEGVYLFHEYLPTDYHREALAKMSERMAVMASEETPLEQRVEAMADYHYLGIQTQPFYRVNNSLFMGQINHLLFQAGLRPIPHGLLDYEALTRSLGDYRRVFLDTVRAWNPELSAR